MTATIKTDSKWKPFAYRYEVPEAVLAADFDYQDAEEAHDGFFKYRGVWYHLDGFMRLEGGMGDALEGWQAYHSDSAFSGIVLRMSSDGESYMVGTYCS